MIRVDRFDAWLRSHDFEVSWDGAHEGYVAGEIRVSPEHAVVETNRLARLVRDELLIELATTDEVDEVAQGRPFPPHVYVSWQPGDEHAVITVVSIDDKAMRDALMRLAS